MVKFLGNVINCRRKSMMIHHKAIWTYIKLPQKGKAQKERTKTAQQLHAVYLQRFRFNRSRFVSARRRNCFALTPTRLARRFLPAVSQLQPLSAPRAPHLSHVLPLLLTEVKRDPVQKWYTIVGKITLPRRTVSWHFSIVFLPPRPASLASLEMSDAYCDWQEGKSLPVASLTRLFCLRMTPPHFWAY